MEVIKFMLLLTAKLLVLIISSVIVGFTPMFTISLVMSRLGNYNFTEMWSGVGIFLLSFMLSVVAGILIYSITTEQFNKNQPYFIIWLIKKT